MAILNKKAEVPSDQEPFIDRYRRIMPKWYPVIKFIFESLQDTITNVGAVQVTVDSINGSYALSINDNDRVTGYFKLDGTNVLTEFSVLADKFYIVHPSVNSTTIQAFIVGLVNGVSTVGINGDLVVDNTIAARHIQVDTLDAISGDFGEIEAGVLRSPDGNFVIDLNNKEIDITF